MTRRLRLFTIVLCSVLWPVGWESVGTAESPRLAFTQASTESAIPIVVLWSQVNSERDTVTFALQNTGTKAITAWDVTITAGVEPEARYGGHGVDAFRQFAGLIEGRSFIPPNSSVTATAKLPRNSENLMPVVVKPAAAIFADNSYAGDPKFVNLVFERRLAQLNAWQELSEYLGNARTTAKLDTAALEQILSNVDASIAQRGRDIVRSTFRENLALAIADVRSGKAQVLVTLDRLMAEANQNIAVATAHLRR